MFSLLIVASLTLLASFLCSLFEAALYSIRPARVEVMRAEGRPGAARLAKMRDDVEEPIAAILTINTIAHTIGAAWCGAMVGERYGSNAVGVFAAVFTVLVLALTEIIPKSLGVRYASTLGPLVVWPIQIMIWSVYPIVWLAKRAMRLLTRSGGPAGPSEDEVVVFASLAHKSGLVRGEERRWVENALRLDRVTAGDLRTPRTVVESLSADSSVQDFVTRPEMVRHSRLPLIENDNPDELIGLVHRREIFDVALARPGEDVKLRALSRPLQFVPESTPAHKLLNRFLDERSHMFAVVDEYGGFEGVVTLEDVLECLLGKEIVDEHDYADNMQELAKERGQELMASDDEEPGASTDGAGSAPAEPR